MKWKLFIGIFASIVMISACNEKQISVKEFLKNTDSASVVFYVNGNISAQILIKEETTIKKLGAYIDGKSIEPLQCSDNGVIWFYENGKKKMQVSFGLNDECNFFSYMVNDRIYTKSMSEGASQYLTSIKDIASQ